MLGHFMLNPIEVNAFIFTCPDTREAVLVDVGEWDPRLPKYVEDTGVTLTTIFITHDHGDHVAGLPEAAAHFGAMVISGTQEPGGHRVDRVVGHGDEVTVGNMVGKVVDTAGHTPVGLSLIFPGTVFSGDALFAGSVGGTSSPETYEQQLENIRKNLFTLPGEYEVHVGHGPSTTIGIERDHNPFFV